MEVLRTEKVIDERFNLLSEAKRCECNPDDVLDAIILAVTARMKAEGLCDVITGNSKDPSVPLLDAKGLKMQMIVPKKKSELGGK